MTDAQLATEVPLRPAATVMMVRDGENTTEVFMLQRSHSSAFARSQYVFPGGRVDDADAADAYEPICDGVTDASASRRIGVDHGGLSWLVACIRECFEEAGVLLARRTGESDIVDTDRPELRQAFEQARRDVYAGDRSLVDVCREHDLQLLTDRLFLIDHWITPVGESRRFDTRFFVAAAPTAQTPIHDDGETIASLWVAPRDALDRWANGELQMLPPTVSALEWLAGHADVASTLEAAERHGVPTPILPKLVVGDNGTWVGILRPGDEGYDQAPDPVYVAQRSAG